MVFLGFFWKLTSWNKSINFKQSLQTLSNDLYSVSLNWVQKHAERSWARTVAKSRAELLAETAEQFLNGTESQTSTGENDFLQILSRIYWILLSPQNLHNLNDSFSRISSSGDLNKFLMATFFLESWMCFWKVD